MRRFASLLFCAVIVLIACAARARTDEYLVSNPILIPDKPSQTLFDDALRWSREHQLETGGCFTVYRIIGRSVIVTDAVERVMWRRSMQVQLDCKPRDGIWHTHWMPENEVSVGCNVNRARDLYLISEKSALGLVVCGVGRDSLIPYDYSPQAASQHEEYLNQNPTVARQELKDRLDAAHFTCVEESPASLKRPTINCRPPSDSSSSH